MDFILQSVPAPLQMNWWIVAAGFAVCVFIAVALGISYAVTNRGSDDPDIGGALFTVTHVFLIITIFALMVTFFFGQFLPSIQSGKESQENLATAMEAELGLIDAIPVDDHISSCAEGSESDAATYVGVDEASGEDVQGVLRREAESDGFCEYRFIR